MPKQRLYFLDNLRAFIVLLVIVFHVAMGYTTWNLEWWYVNDSQKNLFFDLFILETDVYIMPIMFFIAGYFAVPLLLKKGAIVFWQEKIRRIVFPWIAGVLLIAPLIAYSAVFSRAITPPDYLSFWKNQFFGAYYQQAHYWFLGILTLFFLLFTIACNLKSVYFKQPPQVGIPSAAFFPLFALLTAVPFFVANIYFAADAWVNVKYLFMIQPVRIGLYLCYFGLGVHAWKNAWFSGDGYRPRVFFWGFLSIIMLFVFLSYRVIFTIGATVSLLAKAGHAFSYAVFCLAATLAFLALFQRFADSNARLWRRLAANSYVIYYIHQCVIIPLAYMVQKIQLNVGIKYLGVSFAALMVSFLIAEYVVRPMLSLEKAS
jgi:glucans biosynthesis protein C